MHMAQWLSSRFRITLSQSETNPAKIPERDMIFNLSRLGYKEIGPESHQGEKISLEYIITSILITEDARRNDAIPMLMTKSRASYNLLIFLSQKYHVSPKLLGLLIALNNIAPKNELSQAIQSLETLHTIAKKADQRSIERKMTLYGA
jgi:hypothetical protein